MSVREANDPAKSKDPDSLTQSNHPPGNSPQAAPPETASQPEVSPQTGTAPPTPAAERRKNAAHGVSRGCKGDTDQAPEERKKACDTLSDALPLTNREIERDHEIKKLEASIDGAIRGHRPDLRTVFNAVALTPRRS